MSDTRTYSSDVAFTPAVKAVQAVKGSRQLHEERGNWRTEVDENLAAFLANANSFYLSTASAAGQPYIQHRGGPKGFIRVLDRNTLAFADYRGNRQYITLGNLSENPKAYIFVMDYAHGRRVKIWGEARVVANDPALMQSLMPKGFIKVLDKNTIAFADYRGNRQYITLGNLSENSKAYIFVMDYVHRRRVKIWGEARVVADDSALMQSLMPQGYKARPEQVILFRISAWDTNCPQHIPQKFDAADVAAALAERDERIEELEAQLAKLRDEPKPAA